MRHTCFSATTHAQFQVMRIFLIVFSAATLLFGCRSPQSGGGGDVKRGERPRREALNVEEISRVKMTRARSAATIGNSVFVAQVLDGMTLVDLAKPSQPRVVRRFAPKEIQPLDMVVDGQELLIADRFRGLVIWDVSTPDAPTSLSALALPGIATGITLTRKPDGRRFAAMACGGAGLQMVDVTSSTAPRLLGGFTRGIDYAREAAQFSGGYFIADNADGGLKLLDTTDPAAPRLVAQWNHAGFCESVQSVQHHVVTAWRTGGVAFYGSSMGISGTSRPEIPMNLNYTIYRSRSYAHDAVILSPDPKKPAYSPLVAVADGGSGVVIYDITNQQLPIKVAEVETGGDATGLVQHGPLLLACCWDAGLVVLKLKSGD